MEDSVFAKIVAGDIPCHKIYEDQYTLAFLDIYPKSDGHVMVIPKIRPAEFVWDLDDDVYEHVMRTCKKLALHLRERTGKPYIHEAIVGTDVPYAHVHLIPFTTTADLRTSQRTDIEPDHEAFASLAAKLRLDD